jgi:hypothetical protein
LPFRLALLIVRLAFLALALLRLVPLAPLATRR